MAQKRIGALIIIERLDRVEEFITEGQHLEGDPSPQLLMSIFQKGSPLHDGAVLMREGRVTQVTCYLPLSPKEDLPKEWGTRHRAALGLSERSDALIVLISEERGDVSLAYEGRIDRMDTPDQLTDSILEAMTPLNPGRKTRWERIRILIAYRWYEKMGTLLLVAVLWLLLAGQQDFEVTFQAPVEAVNIPAGLVVLEPLNPKVRITVRGLRKDASTLNENNVAVDLDVSTAQSGNKSFLVTRDQIRFPNDRIYVVNIQPAAVDFTFKEKQVTKLE
jgi:hypothetical protein